MTIALLVMTDGRDDYLMPTLKAFDENVTGDFTARIIHDDTGNADHARWLAETFPDYMVVGTPERSGFGGAIRSAWGLLPALAPDAQYILHWEDDFVAKRPVDVNAMAGVLASHPYLAHIALRRQPWNEEEKTAGGIIELVPEGYNDKCEDGQEWLEHRMFWTTNPSLYRSSLINVGWPEGPNSEGHFGPKLRAEGTPEVHGHDFQFAFWGARDSGEWVEHIGTVRAGTGY